MSREGVKVVIMDRQFTVACKKNEQDDLLDAAAHLDKQLRVVQAQSKVAVSYTHLTLPTKRIV